MSHQAPARHPHISVSPEPAMLDTPLQIRLTHFPAQQPITLRMRMRDSFGRLWSAHARFLTDEQGGVDVSSQSPLTGTYREADPMGLIWSMTLVAGAEASAKPDRRVLPPVQMALTAEMDGRLLAETTFERLRLAPNVQRRVIREQGLVGTLFCPVEGGPYPGILLLGGSEGGLHELDAALLAAHGYVVLALAYFGMEGVPPFLVNIPLEYFETALAWLQGLPQVQADRLGVIGGSRGGEAALLIGATFPIIGAVVSIVGSGVLTQGIGAGTFLEMVGTPCPSWTYRGRPLPFVPTVVTPPLEQQVTDGEPVELGLSFLPGLEDAATVAAATIPVEQIHGAVLLVSAGDDRMWPSHTLSQRALERLARHQHRFPVQHLTYQEAGHAIAPPPYGPSTEIISPGPGVLFATGGTPKANAKARAEAWQQTLRFFADALAR